jgi:hypothetical protein
MGAQSSARIRSFADSARRRSGGFPTLIGREDALRWLEARRSDSASMPAVAYLVGEGGTGKTRLLNEACALWSSRGDCVYRAGPDATWAHVGDAAVRSAIQSLALGSEAFDPSALANANREAQRGLIALFGVSPPVLPAHERRAAVAEALRWALNYAEMRAVDRRIILAIDDLDFVDGTSRTAFSDVLADPAAIRGLLVATYSPDTRPIADGAPGETWYLGPLPYAAFATLLPARVLEPGVDLPALHAEALMAWCAETTDLPPRDLATLTAKRIDRLDLNARQTLRAIAVWGDDASFHVLERVVPLGIDVSYGLSALERARMIAVEAGGIRIAHPLTRWVALETMPEARKRELCGRASAVRPNAPLEVRARDAEDAGSSFEALSLLDALAARRTAHGDIPGAVSALRRALDLARGELQRNEIDDPTTAVLLFSRKLAEALVVSHRWRDADGILREALGSAPPNSEHRAHLLGVMARVASARRHPGEARRFLDEAIRVARQSDARALLPLLEDLDKTIAVA